MNIYVGNLSYDLTEEELRQAFEAYGTVSSATLIADKFTGKPRGFGFVVMPEQAQGQAAIDALNGKDLKGRRLNVNEARPREERPPRSGGGGGGDRLPFRQRDDRGGNSDRGGRDW